LGWEETNGQAASVAQTPSAPNTPDPDNADDGAGGGGDAVGKEKKKVPVEEGTQLGRKRRIRRGGNRWVRVTCFFGVVFYESWDPSR